MPLGLYSQNSIRLKARVILERLICKCSYEILASFVPEKNKKLIVHIRKMTERQKRKKLSKMEDKKGVLEEERGYTKASHKPRCVSVCVCVCARVDAVDSYERSASILLQHLGVQHKDSC